MSREISINVVCATSQTSDQLAHTRSLIRAFASRLNTLRVLVYIRAEIAGVDMSSSFVSLSLNQNTARGSH